jgi:hypothetical protein
LVSFTVLSLSHSNGTFLKLIPKSFNVAFIHKICAQQLPVVMYSASVIDSAILFYFLDDHETSDLPNNWQVSEVLFLSTLSPAYSESEYPTSSKLAPLGYHNPTSCVCFKYLNILFVAFKWLSLGEAWNLAHMHTLNITSGLDTVT